MYPPPHSHAQKWTVCKKDYFTVTADTTFDFIGTKKSFLNSFLIVFCEFYCFFMGEILANFFSKKRR
jgi:hypothetical protein